VSLILEALKKLEREKPAPDRGFLVVAHVPWTSRERGRSRGLWLVGGGVAVAALLIAPLALKRTRSEPAVPAEGPPIPVATPPLAFPTPSPARAPTPASPRPAAAPPVASDERRQPPVSEPPLASPPASPALLATPPALRPAPAPLAANRPPATDSPSVELRLNAISRQDGQPVAILNDRLVREGDVFDGIRVLRIGETEVEVEVQGARRIVRF
jgi:hypothetical protein